jgi:hypothetical protein
MPFENISKRKLAFAPKIVIVDEGQEEFRLTMKETNFSHTERIIAPNKMIFVVCADPSRELENLPELTYIEGHLSLPEGSTVVATKLTKIEGDLHMGPRAKFYAPVLQEVTGFIYIGNGATINAPKIENMFSNDDTNKIVDQTSPDWLNSL